MKFKTIKADILDLIKYQQALAAMNGIQLTSWQALKEGIIATGKAMLANPVTWVVASLTSIVTAAYKCSEAIKEVRNKAQELNETFSSAKTEVDDYKSKINDLYEIINDSSSSYSETTQARKDLMSIQDELIDKYGSEESAIKNITDAINGQSDALDKLTAKEWTDTKNKFNDSGFWNDIVNKADGYKDNIDRMLNEYGNYTTTIDLSKYGGTLFTEGYDEFKKILINDFGATVSDVGDSYLELSGNADEVYKKLLNIQALLDNKRIFKPDEEFSTYLGSLANDVDEVSNKYEDFYNQYILYEKIFKNDNYTDTYKQIAKAYSEYQDVFATGNQESIEKAKQNFAEIVQQATSGISDQSVVDYFNSMYPDLQAVVGSWEFEVKFKAAVEDDKDNFENEVKDAVSKFGTADNILDYYPKSATQDQIDAYTTLMGYADKYKMSIEELVALLEKLGIIASQTKNDLYNKLVPSGNNGTAGVSATMSNSASGVDPNETKKWIESISDEDATLIQDNMPAFNKALEEQKQGLNGASLSAQNYQNALDNMKQSLDDTADKTSVSSFSEAWSGAPDDLQTKLKELAEQGKLTKEEFENTDSENYFDGLGISADEAVNKINQLVSASTQLQSMSAQISKMSDMLADKKNGTVASASDLAGFDATVKGLDSWEEFERLMGDSNSTLKQCQKAADALATEWVNNNNFLAQLNETNKDYYTTQLKNMGVENASAVVKNALALKEQQLALETEYSTAATEHNTDAKNTNAQVSDDLSNATINEVLQLAEEKGWSDSVTQSLLALIAQKRGVNASTLNFSGDISNLLAYVKAIGGACSALQTLNNMKSGKDMGVTSLAQSQLIEKSAKTEVTNAVKKYEEQISAQIGNVKVNPVGSSGYKGSGSKSKSNKSNSGSKDTKQTIDWITRALTALEKRLDSTKAKFENLFSLKSKSSNLNTQLKQIKALESGYGKAANAYKKYANKVNLSSSLKKKVQSGSYSISDYSSATQEKIQQYQDYWDKYQDALSKQYEQKQAYREKQIEKYQLYVDDAESKISKYDTKIESTTSAKTKVSYLKEQNKLLSISYDYQIKIAKAEGDSVKAETLSVEKTNKKNENLKAQYQAYLDEADAKLNKYESQYDNLTDTKSRVNNLKEQVKLIKSSYDYQIKIAQVDKDTVKVDQLKAEKQKEINENLKSQYQVYLDEADVSKEMYDAQLSLESNYKEQNAILEKQKNDIIKSYDYQIKIAQVDKDIVKQKSLQAQKQKEINDLTKQEFDNISDTYSRILDYSNSQADVINAKISYIEEKGYVTSKNMYDQLISYVGENLETLDAELVILEKTLQDDLSSGKIKSGTDAWYEMVSAIQAVKKAQIEANTSLIEYEKNIRQLKWDTFNRAEDYISQIQDESNFLIDLMSNRKLYDDNGNWTEYANATAGLRAVNYNAYMAQVDDYEKEIQNIQQQIDNDPYNIDLIERKKELRDTQRDLIKSAKDEQEAIKSLIEEGYNKWLDSLQEVINKRKEELNQVSDLYEYEKKIAGLAKDVSTYEKQKLALQGNDTEEAKAKIQKINVDLQNAKDNLEDAQYDQWKADQESMLDSLSNEAQEFINQRLDNIDGLLSEIVESTNNSADAIRTTLENVTSEVGTSLSAEMTQVLTPMGTITNIVSQFADSNFANTSLGVTSTAIKDYVAKISENSNNGNNDLTKQELSEIGKKEEETSKSDTSTKPEPVKPETTKPTTSNSTNTTKKPATTTTTAKKSTTTTASTKKATTTSTAKKTSTTNTSKKSSWGSWFIKKKFTGNKSKLNKDKSIVDRLKYKDFEAAFSARAKYYKAMGGTDKYTGSSRQNTWMIDQMKKHGFKSGGTIGSVINKSGEDGFVLARTGEEVLSLEKIKELGKSFQMINPVLNNLKTMIPDSQLVTRQNFGGNNIDKVQMEINLPNVTNYEEFKSELVKDKQFEKVVQSMTLGNALGKNSLSKYKIR